MRKQKYLPIMTACLLASALLSGCGTKSYDRLLDRSEPVSITIWHYYNGIQQTQFDGMVEAFNNTVGNEKGIYVESYSKNSVDELAESVLASLNGEAGAQEAPDIFGTYAETAYQIDQMGKLADLSKYVTQEEKAEYVEEYMEEGALGGSGSLKIFPTAKSTEVMMINMTDWQKFADASGTSLDMLGTWEGLNAVAQQYYQYTDDLTPDVPGDGKAFFGRDSVANYLLVGAKQLGKPFAEESAEGAAAAAPDRETVRRLWEQFYVPYVKGYYTAENRFRSDDAKVGAIIALVGSTASAAYYPEEVTIDDEYTYPIENAVLPVPNFEGCDPYLVQQGAGMAVIASDEKTEYACTLFLKWFTEAERNIDFSVRSGYLPVKKVANDYAAIEESGDAEEIGDTMLNTLKTAIDEVNAYTLYTCPSFDASARMRAYIGSAFEDTAKAARAAVEERIGAGEDKEAVLREYTDENAFDEWFAAFEEGYYEAIGE
ncbi:MAG: extracellular solute-binding protein [Bacteroidales bacterium]|nr:extracellular solute-binding protein [Bacteroidales bacterium]MCM1416405.1 extracellular solute-binding protein [bacterium]MCM1424162.1 extracellular solute-binding protein [bacterium]